MVLKIDSVILAGGRARRMNGQDKGLTQLAGLPMIAHTLSRLAPQVERIIINANRNIEAYQSFGLEVISDIDTGFLGPLAGMITALNHTTADYLLVVPCDSPLLPTDLLQRLLSAIQVSNSEIAVASDGQREQPVMMLLKTSVTKSMQDYLRSGQRKIDAWYAKHQYVVVDFSDQPDAFVNINTTEQQQQLEHQLLTPHF